MAFEVESKPYYDSIVKGTNYIDNHLPIKAVLNLYLANLFFGGDVNRVLYSNQTNAFRRRLETSGGGFDEAAKFELVSLQIPFATFWESGDPELISDKQAAAAQYDGAYDIETALTFKFLGSKRKYKATVYFDNPEDLRAAQKMALTEMSLGTPANYMCSFYWRTKTVDIPVFIKLTSVTSNRAFEQNKLLQDFPIFALNIDYEIETVDVLLNRGLNAVKLPLKYYTHNDNYLDESDATVYYTQKVLLDFVNAKYDARINYEPEDVLDTKTSKLISKVYRVANADEAAAADAVKEAAKLTMNQSSYDVLQGFFDESNLVALQRLRYNESKTTVDDEGRVTAFIDCLVKQSCYQYFDFMEVKIPGHEPITLNDCRLKNFVIPDLHPNSTYRIFLTTHATNGLTNQCELEFTTPKWEHETVVEEVSEIGNSEETQIVVEESTEQNTKPKRISPNALIGLDF